MTPTRTGYPGGYALEPATPSPHRVSGLEGRRLTEELNQLQLQKQQLSPKATASGAEVRPTRQRTRTVSKRLETGYV